MNKRDEINEAVKQLNQELERITGGKGILLDWYIEPAGIEPPSFYLCAEVRVEISAESYFSVKR